MHKNIHFGFNWCVASHLCSTQINSKSSKSRKFVCYEPLLKFPEHQFLCSVSVRGPRASRAPSMLGSFPGLHPHNKIRVGPDWLSYPTEISRIFGSSWTDPTGLTMIENRYRPTAFWDRPMR